MSAYTDTPQTLEEARDAIIKYQQRLSEYREASAKWIAEGRDPYEDGAPIEPHGPIMTATFMLELINTVLALRAANGSDKA